MSWSIRRSALVLSALAALGSVALSQQAQVVIRRVGVVQVAQPGLQPVAPPKEPDAFSNAVDLPKDNERRKMIEAAVDYIRIEDWATATRTLQKLLMYPEDKMIEVTRNAGAKPIWVSARREAERLIGTLPPKGLEFYQSVFGPDAKEMLDKAKASGKKEDLALVMNFYLHTDAGGVATHLLATRLLDRGDYITSGLCYERLLNREGADKLPAIVLFEAAYAYHLANASDKEEAMWKQLADRVDFLKIAGESQSVTDLKEQVSKIARAATYIALADCPMVGGSPNRNSQSFGGTAFLESRWRYPLLGNGLEATSSTTETFLKTADTLLQRRQTVVSAMQPITVTVNQNGATKPLIVYRHYGGLQARELTTGKLVWDAQSKWGLENMASSSAKLSALNSWLPFYMQSNARPNILYENSTIGTLSTDGTFVYAVEDLAVPPPPHFMGNPGFPGGGGFGGGQPSPQFGSKELNEAVNCSELQAFELATSGKLKWKVGGPGKDTPLGESYFLGPPLPMGGKVYVLTEKQQELRLACIDAATGKVLSTQVLVTTRDKIQVDIGRRTQAAHLAYGEGILVCPTNAGAVLGVDLLTNSLVWAYSYREEQTTPHAQPNMGIRFNPNGMGGQPAPTNQWKVTPPIIQDGRVVFTAPDAGSVHCLNLRDGTPIWTAKRAEDDLYLGGVYNGKVLVVGKHFTKGYSLAKGEKLWELETGVPSGFGVASDNKYYLPVRESAQTREPEICIVDVEKGAIKAHTKSREKDGKREVPGSLLFYEGDVLSQTSREIVAYPQLEVREKEVTALLESNPNDPIGLTNRGELRLDRGELPGAIDDLGKALDNKPDDVTREKARLKLYESLTDYLKDDFNKAEPFLARYEELCNVEVGSDDLKDKAQAEERRRRTTFLYLVAKGRQGQGKLVEAFDKYQEFSKVAGTEKLISVPDDLAVRTAPDVWTGARIKAMVDAAAPAQRKPLEDKIALEWDDLKKSAKSLDEIRQFVRLFGSAFPAGKEARLELANRLIESTEAQSLIEAELNLAMLRGPTEEPQIAARAVETLARLNAQKGLLPDAAYYYRILRDRYPQVVVRNGKTGAEIFADMESNKFLLPHLYDAAPVALTGKVSKGEEVKPPPSGFQNTNPAYTFDQLGEELPFFKQYRISLQTNTHNLRITNRLVDELPRMDQHLTATAFAQMLSPWNPQGGGQVSPKYHFLNMGHLVVLPLGHMVFGIDPVDKKVLWEKNLYGVVPGGAGNVPPMGNQQNGLPAIMIDPRDNSVQIAYTDGWMQRIGQTSSLEGQVVCLQTKEGLVAIDPLSGRTLWTRADLSPHNQILSDENHFYVVELNNENVPSSTRVLRAQDGVSLKSTDFALLFQKRLRMSGRNLLLTETDAVKKTVSLRLYDVLAAKDQWKQDFPAGSIAVHSEEANLAGMVEPDGKLRVFDVRTQKELFKDAKIDPKHLVKVHSLVLLGDDKNIYLACNGEVDQNLMPWGGVTSNLMPGTGLRSIPVNGEFYAFDRATGELNWHNPVPNQMLVMEHFKEMPLLLFTARYNTWTKGAVNRGVMNVVATESIEKRSGKLKYYSENTNNQMQQFHGLNVDLKGGKIELTSWNQKLVHHLLAPDGSKVGDKPSDKPVPEGGGKKGR